MIKVYVFITGLALYQLAPVPGGTSYAILASGHFSYPGLGHIGEHAVTVHAGKTPGEVMLTLPLEAGLMVRCPSPGGCLPIEEPRAIPSLVDLLSDDGVTPKVQGSCLSFADGANCRPRGLTVPGRNGLLAFTGNWSVQAVTDCGGSTYPKKLGPVVPMNFVRAGRSWELRYDDDELLDAANSVLFTTVVNSMDDLEISNFQLKAALDPDQGPDCAGLPDPEPGVTRCAVVLIRNGSTDAYIGGGDLHFAALYTILETRIHPFDFWLPIVSTGNVCEGGAGTGGMSHCTAGLLPRN